MGYVSDAGVIGSTLGFFAAVIKSGEPWTPECEKALRDSQAALTRLGEIAHATAQPAILSDGSTI